MAWVLVILAGILESGWALGLKASHGFTRPLPSLLTIIGMAASFWLLAKAMQTLPVGTTYAVWTGMGTIGTVLLGILLFQDAVNAPRFWQPSDFGMTVRMESRIDDSLRKGMADRGYNLVELAAYDWHFGSMQLIWRDPDSGKLHGVTDPRRLGYAKGF